MELSLKKIKGFRVYEDGASEPWGIIVDAVLDENKMSIVALKADTLSLIPLPKIIPLDNISVIASEKVIVNECKNFINSKENCTCELSELKVSKNKKLRDVLFLAETGEMTDVIISKNIFSSKAQVSVNKIFVRDNTIYIKQKGG